MLTFEVIKSFYDKKLWNAQLVKMSLKKGILTQEQVDKILNNEKEA